MNSSITVSAVVNSSIESVWDSWNLPSHIAGWAFASDDWEASSVENDLRVGGKFKIRMQAKDKSAGFDFIGTYSVVDENKLIEYVMEDGRHVSVRFELINDGVKVIEIFDPEDENPEETQRKGWQAILNNFKKYVESSEG